MVLGESTFCFPIADAQAVAVLHSGTPGARVGVVIVVGGPQYRVGSHRQFVVLARRLAKHGYPVLRFDYRGIGDSEGEARTFTAIDDDIRAAVDALQARSDVTRVVLWGLCDGASAALMYAAEDERVAGLVLLNPWVHSPQTEARARLTSYYGARLRNPLFWKKLLRFDVDWRDSVGSLWNYVRRALLPGEKHGPGDIAENSASNFVERMRRGWAKSSAPTLVILSGDDLTAEEFRGLVRASPPWRAVVQRANVECVDVKAANHTFASAEWRGAVENATLAWLDRLGP